MLLKLEVCLIGSACIFQGEELACSDVQDIPIDLMQGNKPFDNNVIILEPWSWVNTKYVFEIQGNKKVVKIEIDPSKRLADINQNKNILEFLE